MLIRFGGKDYSLRKFALQPASSECVAEFFRLGMALNLAEVTAACDLSDPKRRVLGIYTETLNEKRSHIKLAFGTDNELEDWIATLNLVPFGMRGLTDNAAQPGAAWGVTERGHVFVHEDGEPKTPIDDVAMTDIHWRHLGGGHFQVVESCPAGVTWALGNDKTAWAYTGGYGGGVFKGLKRSGGGCQRPTRQARAAVLLLAQLGKGMNRVRGMAKWLRN
ncbi:hypothetical protein HPB51_008536 [Rhipicephalus microplus]|uniref:Uncharacterized protein n=1 Tax=Rhipicephalus microplus TaxID=6941 RepID=A0A9J6ESW6_RHIMP|nr:hypothetical protein HPB51_008536 [Rhipicephalus microplus]